jgi:hypothetical protein
VTDEVMVVALSVGACPGGALAALKGLLERFDETISKRGFTTKKGSDDPCSATSRRSPTVREGGAESQQCLGMFGIIYCMGQTVEDWGSSSSADT